MDGFRKWISKIEEMTGSAGSIVSCGDLKNKDFQIQGALSDLKCRKKEKTSKMRFN